DADRAQDRPRDAAHRDGLAAEGAAEVGEGLPLRADGAGDVPRAAEGPLVGAEDGQRGGDVGQVTPGAADVRVTHDPRAAAAAQRRQLPHQVRVVGRYLWAD